MAACVQAAALPCTATVYAGCVYASAAPAQRQGSVHCCYAQQLGGSHTCQYRTQICHNCHCHLACNNTIAAERRERVYLGSAQYWCAVILHTDMLGESFPQHRPQSSKLLAMMACRTMAESWRLIATCTHSARLSGSTAACNQTAASYLLADNICSNDL